MLKRLLFSFFLLFSFPAYAQTGQTNEMFGVDQCIWWEDESQNVQNVICGKMVVPDGSLVDNLDGSYTLDMSGGPGGGDISGTIAAGQVAFGTDTDEIGGDNDLFWNNSDKRLGIGTASPDDRLHLSGRLKIESDNPFPTVILDKKGTGAREYHVGVNASSQFFVHDETGSATRMVIVSDGNVGIGTTIPVSKLEVVGGDVRIGTGVFDRASSADDLYVTGNLEVDGVIYGDGSGLTGLPSGSKWSDGTGDDIYRATGNVGIGTTDPQKQLHIDLYSNNEGILIDASNISGVVGGIDEDTYFISSFDGTSGQTSAVDKSDYSWPITFNGDAQISTADPVFGTGALALDGDGDYLTVGSSAADFKFLHGAENTSGFKWTVDAWVSLNDFSVNYSILNTAIGGGGNIGVQFNILSDRTINCAIQTGGTAVISFSTGVIYPNDSDWHYIKFTYDQSLSSNNYKIFIDGSLVHQQTKGSGTPSTSNPMGMLRIGARVDGSLLLNGSIDELRILKDVADNSLDVPTAPWDRGFESSINFISDIKEYSIGYSEGVLKVGTSSPGTNTIASFSDDQRLGVKTKSPATTLDINGITTFRGNIIAGTDNTHDIGASGATRPRTGHFGTSIVNPLLIGGSATASTLTLRTTSGVGTTNADMIFQVGNNGATEAMRILNAGRVGIGVAAPTAMLHLKAGTASANTAPLRFTSGTSLTTAVAGAMEFTTDDLFFTITTGAERKRLLMADPVGGLTSGRIPFATTNGRLTDQSMFVYNGTNVGIGTSAPIARLETVAAGTVPFMVSQSAGGAGNLMIVTTAGNVGIGTTVPTNKLEISGVAGIVPPSHTSDPCPGMPAGMIFYNSTSGYHCFCDNSGDDIKMNDLTTACF